MTATLTVLPAVETPEERRARYDAERMQRIEAAAAQTRLNVEDHDRSTGSTFCGGYQCEATLQVGDRYCPVCGRPRYSGCQDLRDAVDAVLTVDLPGVYELGTERWDSKGNAVKIRHLLKDLGVKGCTVRKSRSGGCVEVILPADRTHDAEFSAGEYHPVYHCNYCRRRQEARERLQRLILAAFPALVDKSDTQSDYFDFTFIVSLS